MALRKPLVLDSTAAKQQIQTGDDLDIPLNARVDALENKLQSLVEYLFIFGIELPDEFMEQL